jgi:hypothetical protein
MAARSRPLACASAMFLVLGIADSPIDDRDFARLAVFAGGDSGESGGVEFIIIGGAEGGKEGGAFSVTSSEGA